MGVIVMCFHPKRLPLGITYKPFGATKWIQLFSLAKNHLSHTTNYIFQENNLGFMVFCKLICKKKNPKIAIG